MKGDGDGMRKGGGGLLLGSHDRSLGGDGLETGLDGLDWTLWVAGHALKEKEPDVFAENGVGGAASVARDVLLDVLSQHGLDVPLLELALQNQLVAAVDGTHSSQLGAQKRQQMLMLTM